MDTKNDISFQWWTIWAWLGLIVGNILILFQGTDDNFLGFALFVMAINSFVCVMILKFNKYAFLFATILSLNPLFWIINGVYLKKRWHHPKVNKKNTERAITPALNKFVIKISEHFKQEWIWRLFIVLQATGILAIIYLFNTTSIYSRGDEFDWYIGILLLFPYLVSKSINWINEANKKSND